MKKSNMKGFTLVELLAVIVILAIILVIAVPKVMSVIEDAKKATLESTAKMIASQAEKQKVQNTVLGNDGAITCEDITNINDVDYADCDIVFDNNTAKVTITGAGKFEGLFVCNGTKTESTATKDRCGLRTLTVNLDGGTVSENQNGKYEAGSEVTLIVPTKEGYTFENWVVESGEGAVVSGNTLTMGTTATEVKAIWEEINYFAEHDWSTIVASVQSGNHPYQVGNTKTVDMGSLGVHTLRVANTTKCSEVSVESKTACGFVLEFADVITTYNMNPAGEYYGKQYNSGTSLGGWPASKMRTYVNSTIYNALPDELRNGIINTYVVSSYGGDKTTGVVENENAGVLESELYWSNDKLYLLSTQEVYGTSYTSSSDKSNGTSRQLDYYEKNNVTTSNYGVVKKNRSSGRSYWWLRSAQFNSSAAFFMVDVAGYWNGSYAYDSHGVSPAFRLAE